MIKFAKYLHIHILTVILFVICISTGYFRNLCITYSVMLLHEGAHLLAAAAIGLRISHITLYPFGVNLKLKNKMVYSLTDEVILYISGPACNILLAFAAAILQKYIPSGEMKFFYINNIMLFIMNMLPAMPLDGGIILKKCLTYYFGCARAGRIMTVISVIISACITALGAGVVYYTKMNFSILLFAALMVGNIFTQREKYNADFIKELMFHDKKKKDKIKHIISDKGKSFGEIARQFDMRHYAVVYITDSKGKITDTLTETQIIQKLTDDNVTVS